MKANFLLGVLFFYFAGFLLYDPELLALSTVEPGARQPMVFAYLIMLISIGSFFLYKAYEAWKARNSETL